MDKYVISIKAAKDVIGRPCEEWRYAGIDCRSDYPCWVYSEYDCKKFTSIQSAEEWFNTNKKYLFGSYYDRFKLDISTLAIRKVIVIYQKSVSLTV